MKRSALWRLMTGILAGLAVLTLGAGALAYATPRLKPAAPGPEYLSRADHALLAGVAESLKRKRFPEAKAMIAQLGDPLARSLGTWMYFMADDPDATLAEADAFLDGHDDWPMIERIQRFVEDDIPSGAPADAVLAFYDNRKPVSGEGKVALARALLARGEEDAAEIQLRDAWINHNFTVAEERRILSNYGRRLRPEDHAARVDRLLWERQVTNARRIMSRLDSHDRKKAVARAALLMRASDGPRLYEDLSHDDQLDPGVLHAAVRYYRRTDSEQYAIALSQKAPDDPAALRNPEAFWYERQLLMRWALKEGRFADAYEIAARHGLPEGEDFAVAEFNAGWIALRFLKEPERAEAHFLALASGVGTPISLSRAYYWAGRAVEAQADSASANSYYAKAAQYYYSYYGQLAAERLGGDALSQTFGPPAVSTAEDKAMFGARPTVAALRMLGDLNLDYEFMVFAYHADDQLERPGEYVELARLANGEGAPHLTVRAGKVAVQRGAFAPDVAYPLIFVPDEAARFVSPEIILGLSRQESEFNPRAFSRAGARGVMQLVPSTALLTARKERLPYNRSALLDDPVYNITIGSAHLSHLLERFDGSLVLAFAAYNAGASRAEQWIEEYGDPRDPSVDPLDWVELVPFSETRNYIQRVLENVQVYRGRLNDAPIPGRLAGDLDRGGPEMRAGRLEIPSLRLAALSAQSGRHALVPLPERTAERVEAFRLALAAADAPKAPAVDTETADGAPAMTKPARTSRSKRSSAERAASSRSVRRAPRAKSATPAPADSIPAEQPAPAKTESAPAGGDEQAVEPAPIALSSNEDDALTPAQEDAIAAFMEDLEETPASSADAAPAPAPAADESLAVAAAANAGESALKSPDDDANAMPAPRLAENNVAAASGEEALAGGGATTLLEIGDADDIDLEKLCEDYREFLTRNAGHEAAAANLDAGMLAEQQGGDSICG